MAYNEAFEMPALDSTPSPAILGAATPIGRQILVPTMVEQTSRRIPSDAEKLCKIPQSDEPWRFYYVPARQIKPFLSIWHPALAARGVHVASSSCNTYRVAVNLSYVPWLSFNGFLLSDIDPAVEDKKSVQGKCAAAWDADARYVQDAVRAISSGCPRGLELAYRNCALEQQQLPIEWAILWRDLESDPQIWRKFGQGLVFLVLGCCDDYDTPAVLALLRKNETDLFRDFQRLYRQFSTYHRRSIANHGVGMRAAQITAELHRLSIFRRFFEFHGVKPDDRQHEIDPRYTATDNANVISSVVGIEVLKPFGSFDTRKILDALSKSTLFPNETVYTQDFMKLSTQMIASLPIGIPLDIPLEILNRLDFEQEQMIHAQIAHFYHEHPSLQRPRNNILVVLCWNSIKPAAPLVLSRWAASIDSWVLYRRLIEDIQHSQSKEQLVLNLGALLCYHRLLPPNPNANQHIKGSNLADFDAILKNVEYLGNYQSVLVHMALSVLRVFWTVKDDEKMRQWLATVLNLQPPSLDPFHESSDQYWTCRVEQALAHGDALDMAELKLRGGRVGPARCGTEPMVEEITILDDKKKQESGMTTTDDGWVLVGAQRKGSVASPWVPGDKHPVSAFPPGIFHLEAYRLVHVYRSEVPPNERILSTIRLPDNSSVLIVLRSYVSTLESDLRTGCLPYDVKPSKENVRLLGFVKAQNQQIDALASMAVDAISRDTTLEKGLWVCADPLHVLIHFTTWLRGVVLQSTGGSLAYPELTGIESDPKSGRVQLDGYNFNSYTLVRVSNLGQHAQRLDKVVEFDAILSMDELEDESWELVVSKRFLPVLTDMLHKMVPDCIVESNYDPTEPNAKDVEKFGPERARMVKTHLFRVRAEHCMRVFWPKAAAFYRDLVTGSGKEMVVPEIDEEIDIHGNEEHEEEIMVEECMDECWEMIQTLRLQS